ncbi:MAG: hypothetical protein ACU0CC_03540 [Sagittula sp.]|jgi:hypothetical protein|uniref:hypothetical protein n=1 Tax=unclassified Sagittula TaxID=2624628 RepID=UPI0012FD1F38|nr:hypothetical protein [Sagittula sp. P11]
MNIGGLIRRAVGAFARSRTHGHYRGHSTYGHHQSAEAQAARGLARMAKKKL